MDTTKTTKSEIPPASNNDESRLIRWPPHKLKNKLSLPSNLLINFVSFLIVAANAAFVGYLLQWDGRENRAFMRTISSLGPTAVPLMFSIVVGRAVRTYAHWRLQEGERIATLDTLFGSVTFTSTFSSIIDMKRIGSLGSILVVVWLLSPLGGQAALRVLVLNGTEFTSNTTLSYLDHDVPFPSRYKRPQTAGRQIPINTLVLGSIGATDTVKWSHVDTWGNIKVPVIESFTNTSQFDSDEWIQRTQFQEDIVYSSLLGVPIANLSLGGSYKVNFVLQTSYLKLHCTDLRHFAGNASKEFKYARQGCGEGQCVHEFDWGGVATVPYPQGMRNSTRIQERCIEPQVAARELLYWSYNSGNSGSTVAKCSMTTAFVDVNITYSGWNHFHEDHEYSVKAMRPSVPSVSTSHGGQHANRTFFDGCPQESNDIWTDFFTYFGSLTNTFGEPGSPSIIQSYLVDPSSGLNSSATLNLKPVYQVGKEVFSARLGQLLNTYWQAMIGDEPLFLGYPENYDGVTKWPTGTDASPSYDNYVFLEAQATEYTPVRIFKVSKVWMAVLVVVNLVLLLAAILDLALSMKIWIPKLLMNISTLSRGNPNFGVAAGGGALPDDARAKLLANVKVRFGDAERNDESRDLIIGSCAEHGGRVSKLTKGRLYT